MNVSLLFTEKSNTKDERKSEAELQPARGNNTNSSNSKKSKSAAETQKGQQQAKGVALTGKQIKPTGKEMQSDH